MDADHPEKGVLFACRFTSGRRLWGLLCSSLMVLKRPGHRPITDPRPVSQRIGLGHGDKLTRGHQPRMFILRIEIVLDYN